MAIEFQCSKCGATLRAPDGTDGKKSKCKSCGEIVLITPGTSATPPAATPPVPPGQPSFPSPFSPAAPFPPAAPRPPEGNPFGTPGRPSGFPQLGPSTGRPQHDPNPFAAPRGMTAAQHASAADVYEGRDGPPWERDGMSFGSLWETFMQAHRSEEYLFDRMRREGGFLPPLLFAYFGSVLSQIIVNVLQNIELLAVLVRANDSPAFLIGLVFGILVLAPIVIFVQVAIGTFIGSGIYHVILMMYGGANHPFESTYRTLAYSQGVLGIWMTLPCIGWLVGPIVYLVVLITGLARMQQISTGKSALVIFTPVIVCCGLLGALVTLLAVIGVMANM